MRNGVLLEDIGIGFTQPEIFVWIPIFDFFLAVGTVCISDDIMVVINKTNCVRFVRLHNVVSDNSGVYQGGVKYCFTKMNNQVVNNGLSSEVRVCKIG